MNPEKHDRFERYSSSDVPFSIDREIPRCISTCPAGCDVKGYLNLIAEGKHEEAYSLITERIPLPGTLGRICDKPCEEDCKRGFLDESISIKSLKRFAADHSSKNIPEKTEKNKEKVAIIGAGPAGLTAAADLRENGYEVTVFEKSEKLGGMLRLIPEYELPPEILEMETNALVDRYEIDVKKGCEIGEDIEIEELKEEYGAILIAIGLPAGRYLEMKGSDLEGVSTALSFLEKTENSEPEEIEIGDRVIVVGGGNTAIDSARTANRLGADTKIVYRRSREQMPASEEKIKEAEEEGVEFVFLASPSKILGDEKVEEVKFDLMKLGEPDETGRRKPIPITDSEIKIKTDNFIWAIGQTSNISFLNETKIKTNKGLIKANPLTLTTDEEKIFAAGDITRGPATAVEAIADGHRAAESIDKFLKSEDFEKNRYMQEIPEESEEYLEQMKKEVEKEVGTRNVEREERKEIPQIGLEERKNSFKEVKKGFSEDEAVDEANRCLSCRTCYIDSSVSEEDIDIEEFLEDLAKSTKVVKCIDCGECTGSCPVASVDNKFSPRRLSRKVLTKIPNQVEDVVFGEDIWICNTCGICNSVCPYEVDFVSFVKGLRKIASRKNSTPQFSETGLASKKKKDGKDSDWVTDDLDVADEGDVYYFSGCIPYFDWVYDDRENLDLFEIPRSAVKLLNSVGVTPVISSEEKCCGHDLIWRGEKEKVKDLAKSNIETIKETGAETVVFTCPEGLRTFKEDYEQILDESPDLDFVHISEFLQEKDLPLRGKWEEETLSYHDSCRLKDLEIFDAPREILKSTPEVEMKEMKNTKDEASCCGVNAMSTCGPVAKELQVQKLTEASEAGAEKLIVPCAKCWIHLDCANSSDPSLENELEVEEFTKFVADHLIPE